MRAWPGRPRCWRKAEGQGGSRHERLPRLGGLSPGRRGTISLPPEFAERPHDTGFVLWRCAESFGDVLEGRLVLLFLLLELKFKLFDSLLCCR